MSKNVLGVTVLEFAYLAADVYNPSSKIHHILRDWSPKSLQKEGFQPHYTDPFFARLYLRHDTTGKVDAAVVSYRGTQMTKHIDNVCDDLEIALGDDPESEKLANAFYTLAFNHVIFDYGLLLKLTGHSLGGALAQLVAISAKPHPQTIVFNSPGVGQIKDVDANAAYPYIHNFDARHGEVNKIGKTIGHRTDLNIPEGNQKVDNLWEEGERIYQKHKIVDVISALHAKIKVANEVF